MLIIDENLLAIDACLDQVVKEILSSQAAADYRQAKAAFEADRDLQVQLEAFAYKKKTSPDDASLRGAQRELNVNELVYAMKLAENDMQTLLNEVAKQLAGAISTNIEIDEHLPLKKGVHHGHHSRRGQALRD